MDTIEQAITLGGQNLLEILSPEHEYYPYWFVEIDRDMRARCGRGGDEISWPTHNVGRWWGAILRIEAATDFVVPTREEAAMLLNIDSVLDTPLDAPQFLVDHAEPLHKPAGWIDKHSQREVLLALGALVRHRNNRWAKKRGARLVRALDKYVLPNGYWDNEKIAERSDVDVDEPPALVNESRADAREATWSHGRMLEGLVEYYEASRDPVALTLATRIAEFHLDVSTRSDGTLPAVPNRKPKDVIRHTGEFFHTHSLLGTYKGLLKYGILTGREEYVDRIAITYDETVLPAIRESGFIAHDWGKETGGDIASAGDIAQLGLWLAKHGYSQYLDDVEKIVRARILPSQITNDLDVRPMKESDADEYERLSERTKGSFGGIHRHAHGGTVPTTDVTAATLHSLCDVYDNVVTETAHGLRINLHFDYEDDRIEIETSRDETATVTIRPKVDQPIWIRVPEWAPDGTVSLTASGREIDYDRMGVFVGIPAGNAGAEITLEHELPGKTTRESIDGTTYEIEWKGDDVVGISPNTDFLPFYSDAAGD